MANIILNPAIQIISGDVAGFVYRQQADGSVTLAKKPVLDPDRELSEAQTEHIQKFKEASARYRRLMEDAGLQTAYQKVLEERGSKRMRALVIGDILRAPKVSTIDLSKYAGEIGNPIRIIAEDSVGVSRLTLRITDVTSSQVVESAEMPMNDKVSSTVEWEYLATQAVEAGHEIQVHVSAYDLAGNVIEADQAK
jgi:hypothetical protein